MPDDYRISDLSTAPSIGNSDLMELSVVNSASESGYTSMKAPVLNLANKIVNETQYVSDLQTQNKTITGAINELAQGGGGGGGDADVIKTASGNPCSFSTSFAGALKSLTANIVCGGGNGTPSNPIPIVGHTELNLTRCGKNLVPKGESSSSNGITFTVQDNGEVIVTGTATATAFWAVQFYIPSGSYILNGCPSGGTGCSIDVRNGRGGSGISGINGDSGSGSSFTRTEELTAWLNIRVPNGYSAPSGGLKFSPMIRLASDTSSEYAPYNGQTFTVAFGQTVYGGVYDKSGRLTITHGLITQSDCTSITDWTNAGGLHIVRIFKSFEVGGLGLCSHLPQKTVNEGWTSTTECFTLDNGENSIRIYTTSITLDDFLSRFADLQLVYPLATPIVIDVSSISPSAVVGTNNIVSDGGGDVDAEYYTDLAEDIKGFIGDGVEVGDLANVEISTPSDNQILKYDALLQKWVNGTGGGGASWIDVTGTLVAGQTSITFSDASITTSSTIDYYTDTFGVNPTNVSVVAGEVTLTFDSQASDLGVKVRIT